MATNVFWIATHVAIVIAIYLVYVQSRVAFRRINEHDKERLQFMIDLRTKAETMAARQEHIAQDVAANMASSATIHTQLIENTTLTEKAAEASAVAVDTANHMNEKIAQTHAAVVGKLQEIVDAKGEK